MLEVFLIYTSQLLMIFLRLLNVRVVAQHKILYSVLLTGGIQASWLVSSALGIKGLLEGNYIVVLFYILGGMTGSYLSFKIRID